MPRVAGKDFKLEIEKRESFETCVHRCCQEEVIKNGLNLTCGDCLVNWDESNKKESLIRAYNFLSKVAGQIGASKLLHFSFPSLCLMWDNDQIRWLYKVKGHKKVSGDHYAEYHRWAKGIINSSKDKNSLTRKYEKELPRVFDMCVWKRAKGKNSC